MSGLVTTEEAELLRLTRAVVGLSSYGEVERLLVPQRGAPDRLGPTAMELLKGTLSNGVARAVMRGGGWRHERNQRLWERVTLPPLDFRPPSFALLQWLLRTPMGEAPTKALPDSGGESWADELVLALSLELLTDTACERAFAAQRRVRASAMCWVLEPAAIARATVAPEELELPVFDLSKVSGLTFFLEAWQPTLARAWVGMEERKGRVRDPAELLAVGRTQAAMLDALLKAADLAGRRDLLGFLVEAGAQVLQPGASTEAWVRSLSPNAPLRSRTEARKGAGAFLRALSQLRAWDHQHRAVRFFEDAYPQAQAMVKAWELLGDRGFREAERLLLELEHPV